MHVLSEIALHKPEDRFGLREAPTTSVLSTALATRQNADDVETMVLTHDEWVSNDEKHRAEQANGDGVEGEDEQGGGD